MNKDRIIIGLKKDTKHLISDVKKLRFTKVLLDRVFLDNTEKLEVYASNENATYKIINFEDVSGPLKTTYIVRIKIKEKDDESKILEIARIGVKTILIEPEDWRIIPLENIIAKLEKFETRIIARARSIEEIATFLEVMERGVDLILYFPSKVDELKMISKIVERKHKFELIDAEIIDIKSLKSGERVCIDTASLMNVGEGALVGAMSNFYFLVHSEVLGSKFSAPRPFRINAGAVSNYIMMADGKTKYLSEIESGDEIVIVNQVGQSKIAVVGRAKIERRPLYLIKAKAKDSVGSILLQEAETIMLIKDTKKPVSITDLKIGDRVLVHVKEKKGRHFGIEVDEFILEK